MNEFPFRFPNTISHAKNPETQFVERLFHRIEWLRRASENAKFRKSFKLRRHGIASCRVGSEAASVQQVQFRNGHAVLGERSGLVSAEDSRRTQCLDCRGAAG